MSTDEQPKWTPADEDRLRELEAQRKLAFDTANALATQWGELFRRKDAFIKTQREPLTTYLRGIIKSTPEKIENLSVVLSDHAADLRRPLIPFDATGSTADLDGVRLRWLAEDHANPEVRAVVRSICNSIPTSSISAVRQDIDANIAHWEMRA